MSTPDDPTTPGPSEPLPELPAQDVDGLASISSSSLTEDDDAFVLGLLMADQGTDPLPADIAARWDAAVAAESATRAAEAAVATGAVIPMQGHRGERAPGRGMRFAGIAASIAAIALVGGIVANSVLAKDPVSSSPDAVTAASGPLPLATTVSTSGLQYQPNGILSQVGALLKGTAFTRTLPPETPTASPDGQALPKTGAEADSSGTSASTGQPTSSPEATSDVAPKTTQQPAPNTTDLSAIAFRTSEKLRAECLAEINSGPGAKPVLLDLGYYNRKPAALIVLPTTDDPVRLDVWIVGPGCHKGDAEVLWFGRVTRP